MPRMPGRSSWDSILEGPRRHRASRREGKVSTEAEGLHRDVFRIQAQAGPLSDKTLEEIVFRAEHGVLQSLAPYPRAKRVAL